MGQLVEAIKGIGAACEALDSPVVSGNVSLYNETDGQPILPTPAIGAIGVIQSLDRTATVAFKAEGEAVVLIGGPDSTGDGWLGQSIYLRDLFGVTEGAPPPVDLDAERRTGDAVRSFIAAGQVTTCHDISDGGLAVALAEMALAGDIGVSLDGEVNAPWLFGEDQGRYIVTCAADAAEAIVDAAKGAGLAARRIGTTGGSEIKAGGKAVAVSDLRERHEGWFPSFMAA